MDKYVAVNYKEFAHRCMDGEAVVVSLKARTFFSLNQTAALIWQKADGQSTIKDIAQKIHREFDVDYATAEKDCLAFIRELSDKGLLDILAEPA